MYQTTEYAATHRRRRRWQTVVTCLAAVVVFCTTYALILPAITLEAETVCGLEEHTHTESCYTQEQLIVCGLEESEEHTHEADCFQTEARLTCGLEEHTHTEECYAGEEPDVPPEPDVSAPENEPAAGGSTSGESALPEEAAGETPYLYSYEDDAVSVSVALAEGAEVPADAVLRVTPITAGDTAHDYDALAARAEETVSGEVSQIALYDISFFAPETGEYIPVSDAATVTFRFKEALLPEDAEEVAVLHYEQEAGAPVALEEVSVQRDETAALSELTFRTEGFSVYAVVMMSDTAESEEPSAQAESDSFTLTYSGYTITFNIVDSQGKPILGDYSEDNIMAVDATRYIFGAEDTSTADTDCVVDNIAPEIEGYIYTGATYNSNAVYSVATSGYNNSTAGGGVALFRFYGTEPLAETQYYTVNPWPANGVAVTLTYTATNVDYSGTWAIVNTNAGVNTAMLAADFAGKQVGLTTVGGTTYVADSSVTVWNFARQEDGTYYISAEVDDAKKYLAFDDENGSIILSGTACPIVLEPGTDANAGKFRLTDASKKCAVTLSGDKFTAAADTSSGAYQGLYPVITEGDFLIYDDKNYVVVNLVDQDGKSLSDAGLVQDSLKNLKLSRDEIINFAEIAKGITIDGYTYAEAQLVNKSNVVVEHVVRNGSNFVFHNQEGHYTSGGESTLNLVFSEDYCLRYDLNLPLIYNTTVNWVDNKTPALPGASAQHVGEDESTLYAQPENYFLDPGTAGIQNLYRFVVNNTDLDASSRTGLKELMPPDFNWYGEQRFDGWTCTVDGTVYLLDPGSTVTKGENGALTVTAGKQIVTDADGNETIKTISPDMLTLPAGTALRGHWTEVSNVVTFFVNYKGTILDTEGNVSGRRTDTFTKAVAVGHVYFGRLRVGEDQTFAADANAEITNAFRPEFDPSSEETQIVVEYLRECTKESTTGTDYETAIDPDGAYGANSLRVEAATLLLLNKTGRTIQVATGSEGSPNPEIDNRLCDTDHYQIRWYVMKEQNDTWHIDGVLVAKTAEIAVTKTVTGLDDATVHKLMDYSASSFRIPVTLGSSTNPTYLTMTTDETDASHAGQYEYAGQRGDMHSYYWTLHAITDEKYTLSEDNYAVAGYDVTSIIVHYYTGEDGKTQIKYIYGTDTADFTKYSMTGVIGGQTTAVSFNNLYTKTGTGALAIVKRDSNTGDTDVTGKLQGAVFGLYTGETCIEQLKDSAGNPVVATSNINGTAYFNNLEAGTYYLKEIDAPEGYQKVDTVWKVMVTTKQGTDGSTDATVTLYEPDDSTMDGWSATGKTCYDGSQGGLLTSFTVLNEADSTTVTVTKTFEGLTSTELAGIYIESQKNLQGEPKPDGYYIEVSDGVDYTKYLTLQDATPSQDQKTFTWTLHDVTVTDGETPVEYTISEYNCKHPNYKDTAVTATVNGAAVSEVVAASDGSPSPTLTIERNDESGLWATISNVTFDDKKSDTVTLTNRYTNTFDLRLTKVDSESNAPLAGAEFDIYGPYRESTDTSKKLTYTVTDPETGAVTNKTVYYIETITSGEDGVAVQRGLQLSEGDNTFVYVLNESKSPNGYARDPSPKVITVAVTDENYTAAGVYAINALNTPEEKAKLTLTATKEWAPIQPGGGTEVTLELYQVEHTERNVTLAPTVDAELISSVTLDGTAEKGPANGKQGYESAPWTATWVNLPTTPNNGANYGEETGENHTHYHYFVREVTELDGYVTSYTCYRYDGTDVTGDEKVQACQKLNVTTDDGTETIDTILIADMAEVYNVKVTNTAHFELPDSGGSGTHWYTAGGLVLSSAALLYGYRLRRRKGRRSMR